MTPNMDALCSRSDTHPSEEQRRKLQERRNFQRSLSSMSAGQVSRCWRPGKKSHENMHLADYLGLRGLDKTSLQRSSSVQIKPLQAKPFRPNKSRIPRNDPN